jgi:hypothetical protein
MALGATTYKTPNIINLIASDMTGKEGCGVYLQGPNLVKIADLAGAPPYGIIVTGTDSLTPGTYPSAIGDAALELVDQLGCVVQVLISSNGNVSAGDFLLIDSVDQDGTFASVTNQAPAEGDWVWGLALTDAASSEQCLMRFQPQNVQYIAPPPP